MLQALTKEVFIDKVFDFQKETEWNFKGDLPAIVDFYADWCGPCKMIAPILDEISQEYDGKLNVYKVNVDAEQELAGAFKVQSIPTIMFIPKSGDPRTVQGALPKSGFLQTMKEVLSVE